MEDMNKKTYKKIMPIRLHLLFLFAFIIFTGVIIRLGIVQIVYGQDYTNEVEKQEDVDVSNSVPRGKIYDRNFNTMVGNSPLNAITYTRSASTTQEERLEVAKKLSKMIKLGTDKITERDKKDYWILTNSEKAKSLITSEDRQKLEDGKIAEEDLYQLQLERITEEKLSELTDEDLKVLAIKRQMDQGYPLNPQFIKNKDVTTEELAYVSEHLDELPGVNVTKDWDREYPNKDLLRSLLGQVSKTNEGLPQSLLDHYLSLGYSRNDRVGKSYLELQYENVLQGQKEKIKNVTDRSGNVVDSQVINQGKAGKDLILTIDIDMQKEVEAIIEDELRKAKQKPGTALLDRAFVVMTDPKNGDLISIAGKQVKNKNGKLAFDDYALGAMTSSYAMGSSVKGATVLTGYETGAIQPGTIQTDEPLYIKGSPPKKSVTTMGPVNDLTALMRSSNVYMFKTAIEIGNGTYKRSEPLSIDPKAFNTFRYYFNQFGLGVKTGIDLPNEAAGLKGAKTDPGFLLDLSIGQYDTYTPLQMAQYVSTIANGGYRMQPHLVKEIREPNPDKGIGSVIDSVDPKTLNRIDMSDSEIKRVQQGFKLVMQGPNGTASSQFSSKSYNPAGKTGTAQAFYDGPNKDKFLTPTYNTTLVGYAPADNPEVAFSVVVPWAYEDYSDKHSITNNIGERILDKYFELKSKQSKENTANKNLDKIEDEANTQLNE
ncbi:penicillin-binding protein [Bacillus gobiensis]|uniref:serine-type D-Ala-D-Ala carboxypeptidase n=2 Tax=Bacillus TaxID=1386 RepID=A0A0M3R9L5_9BACI|nr:penicillin-binding protein [Bacillus gobiensis]